MAAGTHWQGPLKGSPQAMGGLADGVDARILSVPDGVLTLQDFDSSLGAAGVITSQYVNSTIGAGTAATSTTLAQAAGANTAGFLRMYSGTAVDEGIQSESVGAHITPANGKFVSFGARFKKAVATEGSIFVGLAAALGATDALVATTGALSYTNGIGFYTGEASAALSLQARRSSGSKTGSATIATLVADTYVDVGFRFNPVTIASDTLNGSIQAYIRNTLTGSWAKVGSAIETAIPNASLGFAFAIKNEAATTDAVLSIDYVWTWIQR